MPDGKTPRDTSVDPAVPQPDAASHDADGVSEPDSEAGDTEPTSGAAEKPAETDADPVGDAETVAEGESGDGDADAKADDETETAAKSDETDGESKSDTESTDDKTDSSDSEDDTDILAVRGPRPSSSNPDDPFGEEPAWLQHGSGKRTAFGVGAIIILLAAVAGIGWLAFKPEAVSSADEGTADSVACEVTEHEDTGGKTVALPQLGQTADRQTATVTTSAGDITVLLFGDVSPCGVGGFSYLAQQGFYANSACYRITTQPIDPTVTLRCGDPAGNGKGGPGFRFRAEQAFTDQPGSNYFAMINDHSGTAGSAFAFIRGESQATARMSVIGAVIDGFDVLDQLGGAAGLKYDDVPPQAIQILSVTIQEGTVTLPPSQEPSTPLGGSSSDSSSGTPGTGTGTSTLRPR